MGRKTQRGKVRGQKSNLITIACLSVGLVAGAITVWPWLNHESKPIAQKESVLLAEARRNETKRQAYLDDLLKGVKIPYCACVRYDHDGSKLIEYVRTQFVLEGKSEMEAEKLARPHLEELEHGHFDIKTPTLLTLAGKGLTSPIFVGRKVFEKYNDWIDEDIKHAIIVHEARHVYQHAKGFDGISVETFRKWVGQTSHEVAYDYFEIDAQIVALKSIFSGEYRVSDAYLKETKKSYVLSYGNLTQSMEGASRFHCEVVEAALKRADEDPRLKDILYYFLDHPVEMFGREAWK